MGGRLCKVFCKELCLHNHAKPVQEIVQMLHSVQEIVQNFVQGIAQCKVQEFVQRIVQGIVLAQPRKTCASFVQILHGVFKKLCKTLCKELRNVKFKNLCIELFKDLCKDLYT